MAQFQTPKYSSLATFDTANTANSGVVRGADKSVNVGTVNATGLALTGGESTAVTAVTSTTYDVVATDRVIEADASGGAITINLPAAAASIGRRLTIIRTSASNNVTADGNSSEQINGANTKAITTQYGVLHLIGNAAGTGWLIEGSLGTIT